MTKDVPHYTVGGIETIDFIYAKLGQEAGLSFCLANILKYGSRANHKGQLRSDLEKIRHYAELALERLPEEAASGWEAAERSQGDYELHVNEWADWRDVPDGVFYRLEGALLKRVNRDGCPFFVSGEGMELPSVSMGALPKGWPVCRWIE